MIITKTPLLFLTFLEQRGLLRPFLRRWPISSNRVYSHSAGVRHDDWRQSLVSSYGGSDRVFSSLPMVSVLVHDSVAEREDLYIRIRCVRFSPDGKLLATGAEDGRIRVCHSISTLDTQTYVCYRYGTLRRGGFNRYSMATSKKSTLSTFQEMDVSSSLAQATTRFEFGICTISFTGYLPSETTMTPRNPALPR